MKSAYTSSKEQRSRKGVARVFAIGILGILEWYSVALRLFVCGDAQ